jgi:hypothetical protein
MEVLYGFFEGLMMFPGFRHSKSRDLSRASASERLALWGAKELKELWFQPWAFSRSTMGIYKR